MNKKIGILTSGGDCAGLNAVISASVKSGSRLGYQFIGFERGWEGLLDKQYLNLDLEAVRGISHLGGTILRTTNKGRFGAKAGTGDRAKIDPDMLALAKTNLDELGIEGLIVLGGDGSLSAALQLAEYGVNIVGVPKTMDNDLASTDKTFGFSTAVQVAVDALDKIHTTATSHDRTFFVECMGRSAGWVALYAGLAGNATAILLPEFPFNLDKLMDYLRSRRSQNKHSGIVVVSEAAQVEGQAVSRASYGHGEVVYGGISDLLIKRIEDVSPGEFEMRNVVLGHTQRGGSPNAEDRILSKRYGVSAIEAYAQGKFNCMVCLRGNAMGVVPISEAVGEVKRVTPRSYEYQAAQKLGIFVG
jgi:6-phosphofructokinase